MYRLSSIILFLFGLTQLSAQSSTSPHGDKLKTDCSVCHSPKGWTINMDTLHFNHDATQFPLTGSHLTVDCKKCHSSLVFDEAQSRCVDCHQDIHSMSVGNDCARCHTPKNWLVDNIPELHEENGFPLIGNHSVLSCVDCHVSETNLRFDRIGNECVNCHMDDYMAAKSPDHKTNGVSTNCVECHDIFTGGWKSNTTDHSFFPLVLGHNIQDCKRCHVTGTYSDASPQCASCHMTDYSGTTNPNHSSSNFSTDCKTCHTIGGWSPSTFDHSTHPLVGAHAVVANNCNLCHNGNYTNTPNTCVGCHLTDYNSTTNPNHSSAQFPTDCATCHNETSWTPSTFDHSFHPLLGAHALIANNCNACHNGNYTNTPNTCVGCHLTDYNSTATPNHSTAQYPTDCAMCHTESSWTPSTFDHDGSYFPIYSGKHLDKWTTCSDCHTNSSDYKVFTCTDCHNDKTKYDDIHKNESGYTYGPTTCFDCHPQGKK